MTNKIDRTGESTPLLTPNEQNVPVQTNNPTILKTALVSGAIIGGTLIGVAVAAILVAPAIPIILAGAAIGLVAGAIVGGTTAKICQIAADRFPVLSENSSTNSSLHQKHIEQTENVLKNVRVLNIAVPTNEPTNVPTVDFSASDVDKSVIMGQNLEGGLYGLINPSIEEFKDQSNKKSFPNAKAHEENDSRAIKTREFVEGVNEQLGDNGAFASSNHTSTSSRSNEDGAAILSLDKFNELTDSKFAYQLEGKNFNLKLIYDGHGGTTAGDFVRDNLLNILCQELKKNDTLSQENVNLALHNAVIECQNQYINQLDSINSDDDQLDDESNRKTNNLGQFTTNSIHEKQRAITKSGAAVSVCLQIGNKVQTSSVGDCKAIVYDQEGKHEQISVELTPENIKRLTGYTVSTDADVLLELCTRLATGTNSLAESKIIPGRTNSKGEIVVTGFNLSGDNIALGAHTSEVFSSIGDLEFGNICQPVNTIKVIDPAQQPYILMVTDGILKAFSPEKICSLFGQLLELGYSVNKAAEIITIMAQASYLEVNGEKEFKNKDDATILVFKTNTVDTD